MANLNFQQPPRSIANQGLSRTGFGTSSLSGHVTPTSGMFPGSSSSFTPQQLSPNRNLPPMTNRSLFGQRGFPERRPPVPAISSVMQDWWVLQFIHLYNIVRWVEFLGLWYNHLFLGILCSSGPPMVVLSLAKVDFGENSLSYISYIPIHHSGQFPP